MLTMNDRDLTKWLLKVRHALAEQDEGKRNSMLHAADRFLKGSNQQSAFHSTTNQRRRNGKESWTIRQSKQVVAPRVRN
jgi:hypothetical protein